MSEIRNNDFNFTTEDVKNLLSANKTLFKETGQIFNQYGNKPLLDSIAFQELANPSFSKLADDVHSRGLLSMEGAADHLIAFTDLLIEPVKTIAPWTCVRGLLESCALACWFLDPSIDVKTRVGRCFAFRYKGFEEQIKFFRKVNDQAKIDYVKQRIIKVESDAISLGFSPLLNRNGDLNGIAQNMPSITELIELTLNREFDYRLLSAIAHGHHWAIQQIGFRVIETINSEGKTIKGLKKSLDNNFIFYIGMVSVTSFSKVLWYIWKLNGWNLEELSKLLNSIYDQLNFNDNFRYWKS